MDGQNQESDKQLSSDPQPLAPPSAKSGRKVLQPTADILHEIQSQPQSPPPVVPTPIPPPAPAPVHAAAPPPAATHPSTSIYPEATQGIGAVNPPNPLNSPGASDSRSEESLSSLTFDNGFSLGGTIFWYQLLVGIFVGLIIEGVTSAVARNSNQTVTLLVSSAASLVSFSVSIYIPYSVLGSNGIISPLWIGLCGVASQSVIIGTLVLAVFLLLRYIILGHGLILSFATRTSADVETAVFIIAVFILAYYGTKLAYGLIFTVFGKINNKLILKIIGTLILLFIVGGIIFRFVALYEADRHLLLTNDRAASQTPSSQQPFSGTCNCPMEPSNENSIGSGPGPCHCPTYPQ